MQNEPLNHTFVDRMIGAALLKRDIYEEVEHDTSATNQAALVVVLASLASGIGAFGTGGVAGLIAGVVIGILGWVVWAGIAYFIGTRIFPTAETQADWGQLARTLGFARAPLLLLVVAAIPGIGGLIALVATLWSFAGMIVAVRQALDYESSWRAFGVVLAGFIPYAFVALIIFSVTAAIFGTAALGIEA